MTVGPEIQWKIVKTETATPRVKNFYLEPAGKENPTFIAGQYLTVKLPEIGPAEGKAYSISSAPHEMLLRLSIKRIGDFSSALLSLETGDELTTSAPYGFFYPEPEDTHPLIFVVGGIGITPCLSIIKDCVHRHNPRTIQLYYSNQTETEITFFHELQDLAAQHSNLTVQHYVTREQPANDIIIPGRLSPEKLLVSVDLRNKPEFFICGAMDFTKALWKGLHSAGVPQHQLYTEGFF